MGAETVTKLKAICSTCSQFSSVVLSSIIIHPELASGHRLPPAARDAARANAVHLLPLGVFITALFMRLRLHAFAALVAV